MDPQLFRRHLRKIITDTAKVTAVAGTIFAAGCSINIIQSPGESTTADGGAEISIAEVIREARAEDIKDFDFTTYVPTDKCPVTYTSQDCNSNPTPYKGVFHKLLTSADPSPLTLEQCLKLCRTDLSKLCPEQTDPNGTYIYISPTAKTCVEGTSEQQQRMAICEYELRPSCAVAGRRPAGLEQQTEPCITPQTPQAQAGAFFAELAYLEDAAVTAFQYLVEELKAYKAPTPLLDLATRAIQEEREHVVLMTALAHRYGATPQRAKSAPFQLRPLHAIAIENAREGCVRESFGSLLGFWQAIASEDPAVRATMDRIAFEESNHGALSWSIDEWLRPQLDATSLQAYTQAHQEAIQDIQAEIQDEPSEAMRRYAGFPSAAQAQQLFQQLTA